MTAPHCSEPHKVSKPDTSTESQIRWLKANNFTHPEAYVKKNVKEQLVSKRTTAT